VTIGALVGDEALYRLYAVNLLHLEPYWSNPFYPPAYPPVLALSGISAIETDLAS
jgi:hypothetical protein